MASIFSTIYLSRPLSLPAIRCSFSFPLRSKRASVDSLACRCGTSSNNDSNSGASNILGVSTSNWCAAIGTLGFIDTAYLTYVKLSNSEVFCPTGGGSCSDVLNSEYSYVFGVPLPTVGMVSYALVTLLALQQTGMGWPLELGEKNIRFLLLGSTTAMATASAYFLYLLSTKFAGTTCLYCLISVFLSFSLFLITLKAYTLENIQKLVGLQLSIAAIVVAVLSNSYMMESPKFLGSSDITLDPYVTEITKQSNPWTIALAKHLHSIGAKMYGAFWCSHCNEQKQMFGREAARLLDYIECYPDGVGKGRKMALECALSGLEGFPTWIIKGKVLSGEQTLQALADASEFVLDDSNALASVQD